MVKSELRGIRRYLVIHNLFLRMVRKLRVRGCRRCQFFEAGVFRHYSWKLGTESSPMQAPHRRRITVGSRRYFCEKCGLHYFNDYCILVLGAQTSLRNRCTSCIIIYVVRNKGDDTKRQTGNTHYGPIACAIAENDSFFSG